MGDGRGVHRGTAGRQQHRQGGLFTFGAGLGQVVTGERFASGADRVQGVGLGAVAPRRAVRTVQLDHDLTQVMEVAGEAGAVAAGPFDRPRPQTRVTVGHGHELVAAVGAGVDGEIVEHRAGGRVDDRGGVGVLVRVDAEDDVHDLCETGHCVLLLAGNRRVVPVRFGDRQDCDGTRRGCFLDGQAPDQASHSSRAGAGSDGRTSPAKGTKPVSRRVTPAATNSSPARSPSYVSDPHRQPSRPASGLDADRREAPLTAADRPLDSASRRALGLAEPPPDEGEAVEPERLRGDIERPIGATGTVRRVVFPMYPPDADLEVERRTPLDTLRFTAGLVFTLSRRSHVALPRLARLAEQALCERIRYADAGEVVQHLGP